MHADTFFSFLLLRSNLSRFHTPIVIYLLDVVARRRDLYSSMTLVPGK
jgi:hypothetical protein